MYFSCVREVTEDTRVRRSPDGSPPTSTETCTPNAPRRRGPKDKRTTTFTPLRRRIRRHDRTTSHPFGGRVGGGYLSYFTTLTTTLPPTTVIGLQVGVSSRTQDPVGTGPEACGPPPVRPTPRKRRVTRVVDMSQSRTVPVQTQWVVRKGICGCRTPLLVPWFVPRTGDSR